MLEIKRILCPIDFSDASARAIEQAIALALWCTARITALHVPTPAYVPLPGLPDVEGLDGDAELSRLRETVAGCFRAATDAGIDVDVVVDSGEPASRILSHAAALPADVIVMGTHGTSGFQHLMLGSITEKVLRKASCAVLTVPPHARASVTFAHILCPLDFSDPSLAACDAAFSLTKASHASLMLLYVIEWPWQEPPAPAADELPAAQAAALAEFRRYLETSALMRLETLIDKAALDPPPIPQIVHGKPYVEILRVAVQDGADLIVIGVHGRNVLDMALFGSTTNQVVRQATCPVLTLRQ